MLNFGPFSGDALESYHGRLADKFQRKRPPLSEWLVSQQIIQYEEEESDLADDKFGPVREEVESETSKAIKVHVVALAAFMNEFSAGAKTSDDL